MQTALALLSSKPGEHRNRSVETVLVDKINEMYLMELKYVTEVIFYHL